MGSLAAQASLIRVMEHHGAELKAEILAELPTAIAVLGARPFLSNEHLMELTRGISLPDGESLILSPLPIDDLAERFPCCDVGY